MRPSRLHHGPGWGLLPPLLTAVAIACPTTGSAAESTPPVEPPLVDSTASWGLDFVHFNGMSGELYFVEMMGGGATLFDYDGDGDLDIYLVQGEMLGDKPLSEALFPPAAEPPSDRLLRNDLARGPDGTARVTLVDVTESAGIEPGGYGMGVAAGDIDNDGLIDLYVTQFGSNRLLHNQGDGSFRDITSTSGTDDPRWSVAASFLDYDNDGLLDLYVGNYVEYRLATHRPCFSDTGVLDYCGPGAFPPVSDSLFHNLGGGRFEDVSHRSGLAARAAAGLGSIASDFDDDGLVDLFVANDGDRNQLWINQGDGTFLDEALLAGTAVNVDGQPEASMGVAVGDIDDDGLDDLFMTHLTGETNTLYLNRGGVMFNDASNDSGLGLASWSYTGFGVSLTDFDLDGQLDLYIANGAVKRIEEQHLAGDPLPLRQPDQYFVNRGGGHFVELVGSEVLATNEVGRGVATGDLDEDGDADLLVVNNAGPARLLSTAGAPEESEFTGVIVGPQMPDASQPESGAALSVETGGTSSVSCRSVVGGTSTGARAVLIGAGGSRRGRRVATDGSYASASDPRPRWGLGDQAEDPLALEIRWPQGHRLRLEPVPRGRYLVFAGGCPANSVRVEP